jgi:hypothetical protein
MKKLLLIAVIVSLSCPVFATTDWRGPAYTTPGTQDWFTASNWSNQVPDVSLSATQGGVRTYGSNNYDKSLTTCPVISSGNATTMEMRVGGAGGNIDTAYFLMTGGTFSTQNFLMIGPDSGTNGGRSGAVVMHGGNMILGGAGNGVRTSGHLYVGYGTSTYTGIVGTLTMDGGTIDAGGDFAIGRNYAQGYVYLSGDATIIATNFRMKPDNSAAVAMLDISGNAKIILIGDETAAIQSYIDNGWIKSNGTEVSDYSIVSYDSSTDKTTIMIPEPMTICLLGFGLFGLIRRK